MLYVLSTVLAQYDLTALDMVERLSSASDSQEHALRRAITLLSEDSGTIDPDSASLSGTLMTNPYSLHESLTCGGSQLYKQFSGNTDAKSCHSRSVGPLTSEKNSTQLTQKRMDDDSLFKQFSDGMDKVTVPWDEEGLNIDFPSVQIEMKNVDDFINHMGFEAAIETTFDVSMLLSYYYPL